MTKYRKNLPQLGDKFFLTDGGLETSLSYLHKINLPNFSAFDLLKDEEGIKILCKYYMNYIEIARKSGLGFIMESAIWRANPDWAAKLGYSPDNLDKINLSAIDMLQYLRKKYETETSPMVISGCVGPREDSFIEDSKMKAEEAEVYHRRQIQIFDNAKVDMITAITMTYSEEAIGIVNLAKTLDVPVVVSFKVGTDGKLPSGEYLKEAIEKVDLSTHMGPKYYMINCDHPKHLINLLTPNQSWLYRISGIRANAPKKLNQKSKSGLMVDPGNSDELIHDYEHLINLLPNLRVFGSCHGTDHRHISDISKICQNQGLTSVY